MQTDAFRSGAVVRSRSRRRRHRQAFCSKALENLNRASPIARLSETRYSYLSESIGAHQPLRNPPLAFTISARYEFQLQDGVLSEELASKDDSDGEITLTTWYDGLEYCLGPRDAYQMLQLAHSSGLISKGKKFGLTEMETMAVHAYTSDRQIRTTTVFQLINSCLRFPDRHSLEMPIVQPLATVLITALEKLPVYAGIVFRRATLPDDVLNEAARSRFSDRGFLSCSADPAVFSGRDLLIIRSTNGRLIEALSAHPSEREVVFLPENKFAVERLDKGGSGAILVMHEV